MERRLFVGNLPHELSDAEVVAIFREHGAVVSAVVIRDRDTGHSRGFAWNF
jgi:RNA recognition motif-containing protein